MSEVVVVEKACKRLGGRDVLKSVSLSVQKGSAYCLLGPNGSGKTTLLNAVAGLIKLDSGSARVLGSVGFARQVPSVCEDLSVKENLDFFGKIGGEKPAWRAALVEKLGLKPALNALARELSTGMKKRLEVAVALLSDPDILLLDEPTTGVDAQTTQKIVELIEELKGKRTVVVATHQVIDFEGLCGYYGVLIEGRLAVQGSCRKSLSQCYSRALKKA